MSTLDIDKRSNNPYYQNQQLWMFTQNPDGTVTVSDRCVYGNGRPSAVLTGHDGGTVDLRAPASGLAGQKWKVSEASGVLTITDAAYGKALDSAGTSAGSSVLETTPDANSTTQRWNVVS
ncbi:RICIN domain-containing protein [Streptomyces sp. ET3-23]|uniref:RICIN domain-containing protein n=1 Tax=Streptomyces sp. ET3-23 TaxID=2885643 RepID=UPI001D10F0A2|nr:RICIN domain-containing protein [Streptomyces sp. ET3-23]MCC2274220.1 RICIN domain-containing protein [Streptomyces sp. ET3-23]